MSFKSEAQRRKFLELEKKGKISKETLKAFQSASEGKKLPERVKKKPKEIKPKPTKVWFAKVTK